MRGFVIGPIGDQLAEAETPERIAYEEGIEVLEEVIVEAWVAAGLDRSEISRADDEDRPGDITEQVFRDLLAADLVIADLSGANANVMYELGLRHAGGKPAIQIGETARLPFDISTIRTIRFKRSPSGLVQCRKKLQRAIESVVREEFDPVIASRIFAETVGSVVVTPAPIGVSISIGDPTLLTDEDEQPARGFLDVIADMEEAAPEVAARLGAIKDLTEEIGARAQGQAGRIERADSARQRLGVLNTFAAELDPLARQFDRETLELETKAAVVEEGLHIVFGGLDLDPSQVADATDVLLLVVEMGDAAISALEGVREFRGSVQSLEGASTRLTPPVRLLGAALDRAIATFEGIIGWGTDAAQFLPPE